MIYVIYGAVWPPFYVLCSSVHICHVLRWLYNPIVALLGALCSSQIWCHWKVKINWKKLFIGSFGELLTTVLPFSLSSCNNRLSFHHLSRHVKVFSQWPKISICSWYSYIYMLRSSWVKWVALLLLLLLPISGTCDSLRSLHCYLSQTSKQSANWLFPGFCCLVVPSCLLSELYSLS